MRSDSLYHLPDDLPVPIDDGAAQHLFGRRMPPVVLRSTANRLVDLGQELQKPRVIFCYPRTGLPDKEPPGGVEAWNLIPGARGCTPQTIAFRDHFDELKMFEVELFGLSTQSTDYQIEVANRLDLPFELLSDESLVLTTALKLPTFEFGSMTLLKRLTMIIKAGTIVNVIYPVFPPDKNAAEVLAWFRTEAGSK